MNEQAHTTNETILSEEAIKKVDENISAEQNASEESGSASGQAKSEQVDNFAQMYDMLTERDNTIKKLNEEITSLKKDNTQLLLKVNASSTGASTKNPYEAFIDSMVKR